MGVGVGVGCVWVCRCVKADTDAMQKVSGKYAQKSRAREFWSICNFDIQSRQLPN